MAETKATSLFEKLLLVQKEGAAPRSIDGRFGKARSAEKIIEAYKPICTKHRLYLSTSDEVVQIGDRNYVKSTASVFNIDDPTEQFRASAYAWEGQVVSGLDTSQVSGKTSSYAKKYALQNLFAIDDNKDADFEHTDPEDTVIPVEKQNFSPKEKSIDRAKVWINHELEALGYDTPVAKQAFLQTVLKKTVISNQKDADDVTEALEVERESRDE